MPLDRRDFLKLAGSSALAAGIIPGARLAFGAQHGDHETLVVVFLRGGSDGLNLLPPVSGNDRIAYEVARPDLRVPVSGHAAALPLANATTANGSSYGLHPSASALHELYQDGRLGIVIGAGMPAPVTRSHFDAQQTMELGTPGSTGIASGWLTRHLLSAGLPASVAIPAVSAGSITSSALIGSGTSITMASGNDFRVDSSAWSWNSNDRAPEGATGFRGMVERLPDLWAGSSPLHAAGRQALDAMQVIRPLDFNGYVPDNGASYPKVSFGDQLKMIAQLRKAGLGLRVATIDHGGWDTHNGQGIATNLYDPFGDLVESLSEGLAAFHTDLGTHAARTTVIVMSEFGRRLRQNGSVGTDHGYGNVMLALGGSVHGGQIHGRDTFAGLAGQALFEGEDVMVTVDFRQVLSEALIRRAGNANIHRVFPGYDGYEPLGVFMGSDLPPAGGDDIFANGFD